LSSYHLLPIAAYIWLNAMICCSKLIIMITLRSMSVIDDLAY